MRLRLKYVLGLLAAGALALTLLPWWLEHALRPIARSQAITFERYERVGYGRFRLHNIRRQDPGVVTTVAKAEIDTPLLWAWRTARGADTRVLVEEWKVEIANSSAPPPTETGAPAGVAAAYAITQNVFERLGRWVPHATLRRGELSIVGLAPIPIEQIDLERGALAARGIRFVGREVELSAKIPATGAIELRLRTPGDEAALDFAWSGAELHGSGSWHGQPLRFLARFSGSSWVPVDAEVVAENWSLPAARARMDNEYAQLLGGAKLVWHAEKFDITAEARAVPKEDSKAPPMQARLAAHGDRTAITITAFEVSAPFAEATLNAPVMLGFAGPLKATPARLALRADLSKQSWFDASGVVEGTVEVTNAAGESSQRFQLTGEGLRVAGFELKQAEVRGVLRWPLLELESLEVALDDQSRVAAKGGIDLAQRTLAEVALTGTITPSWFQRWLPAGARWEAAEIAVTVSGPLAGPAHQGTAKLLQIHYPPLKPIDAVVAWQGRGDTLEDLGATFTAGASTLRLGGALARREAHVREFLLEQDGAAVLTLASPATINWAQAWRIDGLRVEGPSGRLVVTADELSFTVDAANLESVWARDWVATTGPAWTVKSLKGAGRTEGGSLSFNLDLAAQLALEPRPAQVALVARGDAAGIEITRLEISDESGTLAHAHGHLPVCWAARRTPRFQLDPEGALQFEAETQPHSALWAALATPLGVTLAAPKARLRIEGTPAKPTGQIELDVQRVSMADPARKTWLPALDNLRVRAHADRDRLVIESVAAAIEGQSLRASAQWPMDAKRWAQLVRTPAALDWREAEGEVEIPDADLGPLAEGRPEFPLAQGRLQVSANMGRGAHFSGTLRLTDATTRPVASVGALQHLTAELELKGRSITLRSCSAQLGGETVTLLGSADLTAPATPQIDFKLAGKNLPLVRKAGLLIRSDLDLAVATDADGKTRISGTVELHDSLVLAELRQLLPTGVRGAERAPPYFAVEVEPYRDWLLDVAVGGSRGVRLHTAVLTGLASPRFQLEGTLDEPRAVGEIGLESGRILFPFAAFQVQLAEVRLSRADPFHPQLSLNATARRYGYDLRLEGRGPATEPILTLSSNPALTAEQVLLLVMAGQAPSDTAGTPAGTSDRKRLTVLGAYLGRGLFRDLGGDDPDRLTITSGEQVTQQGGETYLVEYLLGRRWSLVGEYDEFDDYNVGLKWRVYSEGDTDETK
ncbi:MAG: translocation/assembly module TamB domain-containing protein [Opitutaceae bacterium]|nr:translocation/assembly module TamB domain-containing protein [Opitutaceae bacterium]